MIGLAFDLILGAGILLVSWFALRSRDLQAGIVLYIAFGLLMALAWARLEAPDIALAEAAIGAGVTGALLLEALARIRGASSGERGPGERSAGDAAPRAHGVLAVLAAAIAALAIGAAALAIEEGGGGLRPAVEAELEASGVSHPVTAVLLNFRAYDTWLEVAVLLAAVAGMLALLRAHAPRMPEAATVRGPLGTFTRTVVPVMVLVSLYLLWRGSTGPGGAFQAGAVLAAAGILLYATGVSPGIATSAWRHRGMLVAGVAAFALLGAWAVVAGAPALSYPDGAAGTLILAIEAAIALTIAGALAGVLAAISSERRER